MTGLQYASKTKPTLLKSATLNTEPQCCPVHVCFVCLYEDHMSHNILD